MDMRKAKEKLKYIEKLEPEPKARYIEKLKSLNGCDPYELGDKEWSVDAEKLPQLTFGDMLTYLVFGVSAYTLEQFKAHKSLEAHNQFTNGWVHELKMVSPERCDNVAVKAKVTFS
ncbi:hypothetical protein V1264_022462 [Littorina saxatilis]|uniref:Uncharacterized protein n=1 Tax=Littorina saxatilis TaxID=31220 RepID=A0AAN9AKN9_9CAEN